MRYDFIFFNKNNCLFMHEKTEFKKLPFDFLLPLKTF